MTDPDHDTEHAHIPPYRPSITFRIQKFASAAAMSWAGIWLLTEAYRRY